MNFMNFFKQNKIINSAGLAVLCSFSAYSMEIDIFEAAMAGNVARIQGIIRAGVNVNQKDYTGWTPLHIAAFYDHKAIVEHLIKAGADLNTIDKYGWTPLHVAAYYGHQEIVETLIKAGADINLRDDLGWTPLQLAIDNRHQAVVDLIKRAIKQRALAFTSGLHERLGAESPLQLLNGFEHMTRFIVAHGGLSTKDELKELL